VRTILGLSVFAINVCNNKNLNLVNDVSPNPNPKLNPKPKPCERRKS